MNSQLDYTEQQHQSHTGAFINGHASPLSSGSPNLLYSQQPLDYSSPSSCGTAAPPLQMYPETTTTISNHTTPLTPAVSPSMFDVAQFTPRKFSVDVGPFGFATQDYLQQQDDELFRRSSTCTDMSFNDCMAPTTTGHDNYYVDSYTQFLESPAAPAIDNVKLESMDQIQQQQQSTPASQPRIRSSGDAPAVQHKHVCKYAFCGWSFKRYEHLKRHMLVHTGERPHVCHYPGCGKSFSRSDNFHAHCRTHNKKNGLQGTHGRRQSRVSKATSTTTTTSSLAAAAAVVAASSSPSLSTADVTGGSIALVPQADHTGAQQQPLSFAPATDYANALYDHPSPPYQVRQMKKNSFYVYTNIEQNF